LLLPLLAFERLFERRVEQVEEDTAAQVAEVRGEVATVRADVEAALGRVQEQEDEPLAERVKSDEAMATRAREDVSYENVIGLLNRAEAVGAVSASGVQVPISGELGPRVSFRQGYLISGSGSGEERDEFWVSVVDAEGGELGGPEAVWSPRGPEVVTELVESWQRRGTYPGQGLLNADTLFDGLITTLAMAIVRRRQGGRTVARCDHRAYFRALGADRARHGALGLPAVCHRRREDQG
jgi:hypothetical protein